MANQPPRIKHLTLAHERVAVIELSPRLQCWLQVDSEAKKPPSVAKLTGVLMKNSAIPTFALVGTIIGSESLTAVFGMGTGGTFLIWSPKRPQDEYFAALKPIVW